MLGEPKLSGVRTISSIFVSSCICSFVLVQRTFFTVSLTKDLHRTGVSKLFHPKVTWVITQQCEGRTSCLMWLFRDIHSTKSKCFSSITFHYLQNIFADRIWPALRSLENGFAGRMYRFAGRICPAGRCLENPHIEEWAQRIEVNDYEHSIFMTLRIGKSWWCLLYRRNIVRS